MTKNPLIGRAGGENMSFGELLIDLLQAAAIIYLSRGVTRNSEAIEKARREIRTRHLW